MKSVIRLTLTGLTILISSSLSTAQNYPQDYFSNPLDISLILSGTYGELRSNHFHAGIDIKTQGREGLNVRAAAAGDVVRIAVSPYGYGNALYIRHPNGYTTVYAHLQSFNDDIAKYVEEQQYAQKSFQVNLFPPAGQFSVNRGDIIAKSGNSGGSGGPHLHFEIRDSRTEEPLNPLLFGYDIADNRTPEVRGVYVYPIEGHINQRHERTSLNLTNPRTGEYQFRWTQRAAGKLGFAIDVIDRLDGAWNANGPYKIEQYVNGVKTNEFRAERFSFDETRYLNAHIDYDLYDCCQTRANRMWQLPGNRLRMYRDQQDNGILEVLPDSSYQLEWRISDAAGNTTKLTGSVRYEAHNAEIEDAVYDIELNHHAANSGEFDGFVYNMSNSCLYEDVFIQTQALPETSYGYGPVFQFGRTGIPIQNRYEVMLPLTPVPVRYHSKAVIVSLDDEGNSPDSWDGTPKIHSGSAYISADVRVMGRFTLMVDSVAPSVRVLSGITSGSSLREGAQIRLKMTDDLSGIQSYDCYIDDQWHLMSYDAKNDLLTVELDDRIEAGAHEFFVKVVDDRNNTTELRVPFSYSLR